MYLNRGGYLYKGVSIQEIGLMSQTPSSQEWSEKNGYVKNQDPGFLEEGLHSN